MAKRRYALKTFVFVDSSVLFTAVFSPTGGSAKLFTISSLKLITSRVVLTEVERNIRKKLQSYHLERFFMLVGKMTVLPQMPDEKLITKAKKVIVVKDAVILAEAKKAKSRYLVTLDRKHFLTPIVAKFLQPQKALTPKELLQKLQAE